MSRFDFSAVAPESVIKRGLRRLNPSRRSSQVVLWSAVAVAESSHTGTLEDTSITPGSRTSCAMPGSALRRSNLRYWVRSFTSC